MSNRPIYVLSLRECYKFPAQGCVNELEDVFAELTSAIVLCPRNSAHLADQLAKISSDSADLFFATISESTPISLLKEIRNWRRPFQRVYGYIFDAWTYQTDSPSALRQHFSRFHRVMRGIDHLFVPNQAAVPSFQDRYRKPVSYLAMGADVVRFGNSSALRPISVNAYGRQNVQHTDILSEAFNTNTSDRSLYHTNHMMVGGVTNMEQHRAFFWKMLGMSLISLAYDAHRIDPDRRGFPFPFVGQRWFEAMCAGCVVVGFRPVCAEANELLDWPDATIEAPEDPKKFLDFTVELLSDTQKLAQIRKRNVFEMARAHDWGHRIASMFSILGIVTPPEFSERLRKLSLIQQQAESA